MVADNDLDRPRVERRQVALFVGLTFGLAYLLDLILYLSAGYGPNATSSVLLQIQMLIPATVAIVLQSFFFRKSPIFHLQGQARWFFLSYLAFVALYVVVGVSVILIPNQIYQTAVSACTQLLMLAGLGLVVVLRLSAGREQFARVGLGGGKVWHYLVFGFALVALYAIMTALNAAFRLGHGVDIKQLIQQAAGGQSSAVEVLPGWVLLALQGVQAIVIGPFLGLLVAFGEEYGWRGYLQTELVKLGRVRGILLVGVIWGLWHAPIIVMGHNYPGYPVVGVLLMTLQCIALSFFLGFAVLVSGSIWLAAYLHALSNQVASFLLALVYEPNDPVFSFGIGLYALAIWAIAVAALLFLGRRVWRATSA